MGTENRRWVDIDDLIGPTKEDRDSFEAASDTLRVAALVREMRERAGIDRAQLKQRLKPFLKLSDEAIINVERGMPIYHDRRHVGDNVLTNFVLLVTVARVCGFELVLAPKSVAEGGIH